MTVVTGVMSDADALAPDSACCRVELSDRRRLAGGDVIALPLAAVEK